MSRKLFVNLPVTDLARSMAFYKALGFSFNPQFTGDTAACMVISEHNYAMLLTHERFRQFSTKPIPDAHKTTGVLIAIALESRKLSMTSWPGRLRPAAGSRGRCRILASWSSAPSRTPTVTRGSRSG